MTEQHLYDDVLSALCNRKLGLFFGEQLLGPTNAKNIKHHFRHSKVLTKVVTATRF